MDDGLKRMSPISREKYKELISKNVDGIFQAGEELIIRGSRFRIKSINKKGMKLNFLKENEMRKLISVWLLLLVVMAGCNGQSTQMKEFITVGEIYETTLKSIEICVDANWFNPEQLDQIDALLPAGEVCFDKWSISLTEPNIAPYNGFQCAMEVISALMKLEAQAEGRPK